MIKQLAALLLWILSFGLSHAAEIKLDFSTPEGAILMLEDAYKRKTSRPPSPPTTSTPRSK